MMPDWQGFLWGVVGILILVPIAFYVFRWSLRRFQATFGVKFKEAYATISQKPEALALFHGLLCISVSIIGHALFSKWV